MIKLNLELSEINKCTHKITIIDLKKYNHIINFDIHFSFIYFIYLHLNDNLNDNLI